VRRSRSPNAEANRQGVNVTALGQLIFGESQITMTTPQISEGYPFRLSPDSKETPSCSIHHLNSEILHVGLSLV